MTMTLRPVKILILATLFLSGLTALPPQARAFICTICPCVTNEVNRTVPHIQREHQDTREHMRLEFAPWENWLRTVFYTDYYLPSLLIMTEQITTMAMHQAFLIGGIFDGKQHLEVQRLLQKKTAEAHKDYYPSVGMCIVGTNVRSLANAERRSELTTFVLSQRSQDRMMGQVNMAASPGPYYDQQARLAQFRARYCNVRDNKNLFAAVCGRNNNNNLANVIDRDIDFGRTAWLPSTLQLDFTDTNLTDDEQDIMALASNLYSADVFERLPESFYNDTAAGTLSHADEQALLTWQRQIVAKRSVAENSFFTIAGLKALGSPLPQGGMPAAPGGNSTDVAQYMNLLVRQLGLSQDDANRLLGTRPSYYAQMDVLTKRVFQQPSFFADLYDKPANLDRKKVALQALGLMQDFDTWQSYLRTENILSVLLELELGKKQEELEGRLARMSTGGSKR